MRRRFPFLAVSSKFRLLAAAVVWSAVGVGLAAAGTRWVLGSAAHGAVPGLLTAGAAGWAKGRFILGPRARANAARIAASPGPASLASVFPPPTWLLAVVMMAGGYGLRHSGLPWPVVGWIYAAIGAALIVGSFPCWSAWARSGAGGPAPSGGPQA